MKRETSDVESILSIALGKYLSNALSPFKGKKIVWIQHHLILEYSLKNLRVLELMTVKESCPSFIPGPK